MKSFPTDYLGFVVMNRKFNSPMLPWVVPQIIKKTICNKVNLVVAGGNIAAYEACKDQPLFEHSLKSTLKPQLVPANLQDAKGALFLYVLKGDDGRYHCHLFRATDTETVQELFTTMKEQSSSSSSSLSSSSTKINRMERETPQRTLSSAATLTSIGADISPSSSHFFEVYYVGKHRVNPQEITLIYAGNSRCFKVPETFIDDVLPKFRPHVLEKSKSTASNLMAECQQLKQQHNLRRDSTDSNSNDLGSTDSMTLKPTNTLSPTGQTLSASVETIAPPANNNNNNNFKAINNKEELKLRLLSKRGNAAQEMMRSRAMSTGHVLAIRRESNAKANDEQNRTMLLQIGRQDLRLISPDQKQVFLHKQLKDIMNCVQGIKHPDHFGFISRDANSDSFVCFVFKCQSESVADDLVTAISQAFMAIGDQRKERPVFTCDHCPIVWYNKLSQDIDGQSDRKAQNIIITRMQQLTEEEQEIILTKYKKNEISNGQISLREQNQFLMTLLRIHCEAKQARHVHDTAENRSEFLNQYLSVGVGSTIFMKAKRSLTNSFDHLMKRKGSKDDFGIVSQVNQKAGSPTSDEAGRPRSLRVSPEQQLNISTSPKSPMMDIFFKVGNSPKMSPTESEKADYNSHQHQQQLGNGSWRQAILNRVVTPNKDQQNGKDVTSLRADVAKNNQTAKPRKRTKEELRELWKKAINQQVILIRMERENAKLRVRQEEATVKRIKLEYDELSSCARELSEVWDLLVSKESRVSTKCDNQMLLQAIKQGVPRGKRGDVWQFLAEQFCLKQPPIDTKDFPNYNTPYEVLLQQLTSQQHAILIDLGRTFPNHPYFSSPLGPGQLALFNLLKAYSLLDHEVGYCQGLSFVAGVLLLHMSEDQAFFLLRHLMFRRGLRKLYLPDMAALQLHLYQLSRLLHDRMPALYNHFDKHEVSPTLYAAPWLLTLFASQFPLGFVTRVFDLLFLESSEVIFKVALALLEDHQDQLLVCDSFEEIMEYLKIKVPAVDKGVLDRVMKRVFYPDMEIGKQLNEYRVEYQVLQEEMISVKPQIENMEKLEQLNKQLTQQNSHMHEQIEILMTNLDRLETTRTYLQASSNKLEAKNRSLEVTVLTLGTFIQQLVEGHPEIDIPGDVRRIVAQLSVAEKRSQNLRSNSVRSFPLNVIPGGQKYEPMTKSNSTGRESKVVRSDSTPYPLKSALSQPNLSTRLVSTLFPNNSKLQRPLSPIATKNEENETKTVNIDIQITDDQENYENNRISPDKLDDNSLKIKSASIEKCASLPLKAKLLKASKSSYELGSVKMIPTSKLEDTADTLSGAVHPLDSCSDVSFNYGGTTKLKSIKSVRAPPTQPR